VLELSHLLEVCLALDKDRGNITILLEASGWITVLCLIQQVYFHYSVFTTIRETHLRIHM
jgi:hypothetical protein